MLYGTFKPFRFYLNQNRNKVIFLYIWRDVIKLIIAPTISISNSLTRKYVKSYATQTSCIYSQDKGNVTKTVVIISLYQYFRQYIDKLVKAPAPANLRAILDVCPLLLSMSIEHEHKLVIAESPAGLLICLA